MSALEKAIDILGGVQATAEKFEISYMAVRQWRGPKRKIPAKHCVTLEKLTQCLAGIFFFYIIVIAITKRIALRLACYPCPLLPDAGKFTVYVFREINQYSRFRYSYNGGGGPGYLRKFFFFDFSLWIFSPSSFNWDTTSLTAVSISTSIILGS